MRVITGKYKGKHFDVPRSFKARPTTDFAKENLFNVLRGYIDFDEELVALDLFSGTGSISLELLSREADKVVSIERDPQHFSFISQVQKYLDDKCWFPMRADVFKYIERSKEHFDFIFADPPYALKELASIPDVIMAKEGLLKPDGLLVVEHGKDYDFSNHPCFVEHRAYGSVNFSFFKHKNEEAEEQEA